MRRSLATDVQIILKNKEDARLWKIQEATLIQSADLSRGKLLEVTATTAYFMDALIT
jgi:hypothetical protein